MVKTHGVEKVLLDGVEVENKIKLQDKNKVHNIEIIM